ncbi:hypothetical protein FRC00_013023, partial [Tulasnella sp. 408]
MQTLWASPAHDEQHLWILLTPDEDTPAIMRAPNVLVCTHYMLILNENYAPPELWKVKVSGNQIKITEGHGFRLDDGQERAFKGPLRISGAQNQYVLCPSSRDPQSEVDQLHIWDRSTGMLLKTEKIDARVMAWSPSNS